MQDKGVSKKQTVTFSIPGALGPSKLNSLELQDALGFFFSPLTGLQMEESEPPVRLGLKHILMLGAVVPCRLTGFLTP